MDKKTINVNMDEFYFKKYSKYVKQSGSSKAGINLFLTFKKCRNSCYIEIHHRYEKSFLRILNYYKMNYDSHKYDGDYRIFYIISSKPISEEVKYAFHHTDYDVKNPHIMGKFLEYPYFINVRKVGNMKDIGGIRFNFIKNRSKKSELIYGFRVPISKINSKMIEKMNTIMKKYRKCIQKYLAEIYSEFRIEMNVKLNT
jgi:hypothetical protein